MPKISAYPAGAPLQASDKFVIARGGQNYYILGSEFMPQAGGLRNGKISVTVAGNNLTVALKTLAGANPSASDPVLAYVGGAWRAITAPLSVTKNAGTNWGNAGSAELATKEIDWFSYLGYNAIDGVVIAFSRYPGACIYSNFSTTTTNEKYAGISTITNAAAGDEYILIGRFAATLSAGAGYTWSVPAYTAANLIQYPIYETRWLDWQPVYSAWASDETTAAGTYNTVTTNWAKYQVRRDTVLLKVKATGTTSAAPIWLGITLPWEASIKTTGYGFVFDAALFTALIQMFAATPDRMDFAKYNAAAFGTGATRVISGETFYAIE